MHGCVSHHYAHSYPRTHCNVRTRVNFPALSVSNCTVSVLEYSEYHCLPPILSVSANGCFTQRRGIDVCVKAFRDCKAFKSLCGIINKLTYIYLHSEWHLTLRSGVNPQPGLGVVVMYP